MPTVRGGNVHMTGQKVARFLLADTACDVLQSTYQNAFIVDQLKPQFPSKHTTEWMPANPRIATPRKTVSNNRHPTLGSTNLMTRGQCHTLW
jgi:hypothetical protein